MTAKGNHFTLEHNQYRMRIDDLIVEVAAAAEFYAPLPLLAITLPSVMPTKHPRGGVDEALVSKNEHCSTATVVPGDVSALIPSRIAEESGDSGFGEGPGVSTTRGHNSISEDDSGSSDGDEQVNEQPHIGSIDAHIEVSDTNPPQPNSLQELAGMDGTQIVPSASQLLWQATKVPPEKPTKVHAEQKMWGTEESRNIEQKPLVASTAPPIKEKAAVSLGSCAIPSQPIQPGPDLPDGPWAEEADAGDPNVGNANANMQPTPRQLDMRAVLPIEEHCSPPSGSNGTWAEETHDDHGISTTANSTVGEPPPEVIVHHVEKDVVVVAIAAGPDTFPGGGPNLLFIQQMFSMEHPPPPLPPPLPNEWCIPMQESEVGRSKPTQLVP